MCQLVVECVPAQIEHIKPIADRMRQADLAEVLASGFGSPEVGLFASLERSSIAFTAFFEGAPIVMFGAGDINVLARVGAPWLLGTETAGRIPRAFLRQSIYWRGQLLERYDVLRNVVDDRNVVSKRWLSWLGFTLSEPIPFGVNGELFRVFEMRR